jgi:murein DD-endopeptidase MepM/ murein hydrolase activator NlpD
MPAQAETSIDNIVPNVENRQPSPAVSLERNTFSRPQSTPQQQFSQRQAKLRQKLHTVKVSRSKEPVKQSRPKVEISESATFKDYNNSYIDPTDYNINTRGRNEVPYAVIRERTRAQLAASNTKRSTSQAPSWFRRSQNVKVANVLSTRTESTQANHSVKNSRWRATRVGAINVTNLTSTKYRSIPNTPAGGTLPAPMTDGNVAPRPSQVDYSIALRVLTPQSGDSKSLVFPLNVPAPITSVFGWRRHPITGDRRFHSGIDLGAAMGTPVLAAATGQVEMADYMGGYGLAVILNHNSTQQTLYGHMSKIFVQPGQWVERGTAIGLVGSTGNSTGPHLHFEIRQLSPQGWVATDPGAQLEFALNQLVQSLKTAQVSK